MAKLSKKKLLEQIKKENARFAKLSKAEKRVAIAKDVLAQIAAKKYVPTQGTYVDLLDKDVSEEDIGKEVCEVVAGARCDVCAIGSLFMSAVKLGDNLKVDFGEYGDVNFFKSEILTRFFSKDQLGMMEAAFECSTIGEYGERASREAAYWGEALRDKLVDEGVNDPERELLKMIMLNVVRNGGTFKPVHKVILE